MPWSVEHDAALMWHKWWEEEEEKKQIRIDDFIDEHSIPIRYCPWCGGKL